MTLGARTRMQLNAFLQPIKQWPGSSVCQCYPECRRDCPDSARCYEAMPEYWTKVYRARRYAADVRLRNPATVGSRLIGSEYRPSDYPLLFTRRGVWWDRFAGVWKLAYTNKALGPDTPASTLRLP